MPKREMIRPKRETWDPVRPRERLVLWEPFDRPNSKVTLATHGLTAFMRRESRATTSPKPYTKGQASTLGRMRRLTRPASA